MNIIDLNELVLPSFKPLYKDKHLYQIMAGGRGGGKSTYVSDRAAIEMAMDGRINWVVFRKNAKDNRLTTYKQIIDSIEKIYGEYTRKLWRFVEHPEPYIKYLPSGNMIYFKGFNNTENEKGIKINRSQGFLCRFWLDEAEAINKKEDFDEVDKSFRGVMPEGMFPQWYITFNPPDEGHWLREWMNNAATKVNFPEHKFITEGFEDYTYKSISLTPGSDKETLVHYSVYTENPYLSESDIRKYEREKDKRQQFEHELLGEFSVKGKTIYTNWEIGEMDLHSMIKPLPGEKKKWRALNGLDFGFVDPTAFVCCMFNRTDKIIYIYDCFYEPGLEANEIAGKIIAKGQAKTLTICDSQNKDIIKTLKKNGIRVKGVEKYYEPGRTSIEVGISKVSKYKIIVHPKCTSVITELRNYAWKRDKFGNPTNEPDHTFSHCCDSIRYATMMAERYGIDYLYMYL